MFLYGSSQGVYSNLQFVSTVPKFLGNGKRSDSSFTMASRAWSTTDLNLGLQHLLTDGKTELPEDMAQLEVHCSLLELVTIRSRIYERFLKHIDIGFMLDVAKFMIHLQYVLICFDIAQLLLDCVVFKETKLKWKSQFVNLHLFKS